MRRIIGVATAGLLVAGIAAAKPKHEPKVPKETAEKTALGKVTGKIVDEELEKEDGRWIWSIEIKPEGETGKTIREINVDADTGEVVSEETEKD